MADLDIPIAGRTYRVACEDGQEENLARAGRFLAEEAELLRSQFGDRFSALPESRVLLMASLMLGDRFRAMVDEGGPGAETPGPGPAGFFDGPDRDRDARVAELEAELAAARESEALALAALDDAAARVRGMAGEIAAGAADEDEDEPEDESEDEDEDQEV